MIHFVWLLPIGVCVLGYFWVRRRIHIPCASMPVEGEIFQLLIFFAIALLLVADAYRGG
jgi:hypothetical protein